MVSSVGHNLNSAIRERHPVLSRHNSVLVLDFFLGKVCPRVRVLQVTKLLSAGGLSQISHLNSVLVGERSGGNLCRGVSWSVVERSSVRTVVGAVGRTYGAKLGGSQGETETSEEEQSLENREESVSQCLAQC